jgi:hypothetical protein
MQTAHKSILHLSNISVSTPNSLRSLIDQEIAAFYKNPGFLALFTTVSNLTILQAIQIQSMPSHRMSLRTSLILSYVSPVIYQLTTNNILQSEKCANNAANIKLSYHRDRSVTCKLRNMGTGEGRMYNW